METRLLFKNISTPAILLDLDVFERNLRRFHSMACRNRKEIWPMTKTHKSTQIAKWQQKCGAAGFLCGTLDECEALARDIKDVSIMYAYPVASATNARRVVELSQKCNFYIRLDSPQQAGILNNVAKDVEINYTVIINSGLNRFGISPRDIKSFMEEMSGFGNLRFKGISTHPGHVYKMTEAVKDVACQEAGAMAEARKQLLKIGVLPEIVTSGSTPTFEYIVDNEIISILHPGNYVFMDNIQVRLGCAKTEDCALTILATVIAANHGEFIIDAGSKCFGEQAVHGSSAIEGHGYVKNHPSLIIHSLSEEVGKIKASAASPSLQIGDIIEIIPNHSCSVANMFSHYIGVRKGVVDDAFPIIPVDIRCNLQHPKLL
ncbi:MAG: alanine racemase [Defluviitaleaceae bacterium]|nr:alanine racemase [Defluviitaleaceae bacterium]